MLKSLFLHRKKRKQKGDEQGLFYDPEMNKIKAIMLLFGSPYSFSSIMMQEFLIGLRNKYKRRVKAIFYNVWSPHGIYYADKFEIRVIPTIVILDKEGTEYFRHEGFLSKEKLVNSLRVEKATCCALPIYRKELFSSG